MSTIRIDRLGLRVQGVSAELLRLALDGLDAALLSRLSVRNLDSARLRDVSPSIRLPAINVGPGLDAESLRARIADGLVDWLARAGDSTRTAAEES